MEQHSYRDCSLISSGASHSSLHSIDCDIPSKQKTLYQRGELPRVLCMSEIRNVYDRKIKLQFEDKAVQQYGKTLSDSIKNTLKTKMQEKVFSLKQQTCQVFSLSRGGRKEPRETLFTDLMKGACCGLIKTNRQTPTNCSEASSTYLLSLLMVFCSSTAHSFWFVVLAENMTKGIF